MNVIRHSDSDFETKYSRTSLSGTRLFRITAYLGENLVPVLT